VAAVGNPRDMRRRRWPALAVVTVTAVALSPVLVSCRDDEPTQPTITLKEETINPNVSVPTSG
jgi:hypothetical protein